MVEFIVIIIALVVIVRLVWKYGPPADLRRQRGARERQQMAEIMQRVREKT